jgi:signal transduction histidine kinase
MANGKILIVEDESIIALDIEQSLLKLGYTVVAIAACAEDALQATAEFQPDLVLMDIQLQGERDGIETSALIQQGFQLPVVYLTAHADADTLQRAKLTQPFGYILKPFEDQDLTTAIEIALSRHQAETAIQKALEAERELSRLKSRFVSVVSHEFRNPLSTIVVSLDLLEHYDQQLTLEKKQSYCQRARASALRMQHLLDDVLTLGEVEGGNLQFNPQFIDLGKFCRGLVEEIQFNSGTNHNIMLFEQGDVESSYLDEKLLQHMLSNLLSNAIKYSPTNSQIRFDLIHKPTSIIFRIQDHGIGIPAADQPELFNAFQRGSNVSKIAGTGLGLSIVKQCVDAHGGKVRVKSELGMGTTFTVTLPLKTAPSS